jgi:arylsulfatase A-like enzyme
MNVLLRVCLLLFVVLNLAAAERPNVLWFIVDDMSANFSCYGEKLIQTPNVDRLARDGVRFAHAHVTAPVCSPCRSALITGKYQTSIGAHHHRSGRGVEKIHLPAPVEPVPLIFQHAGYYTCIGDGLLDDGKNALGKTDYNFEWPREMYDGPDWSGRKAGQPFFMQVQLAGGKLRGAAPQGARRTAQQATKAFGSATKPEAVTLPPYYPRDPVILEDWAAYLDAVRLTDKHVGDVLARLEREGLLTNTVVIFMTDHGISHARGKQFLYDEGTHVPLVVSGPGISKGVVRNDLVEANIDLPALSLAAAGIEVPAWMQGRNILAKDYKPRDAVFAARDRCDETVEGIRAMRTGRFKYIRNFYPDRPHLQPNAYKDGKAIVKALRASHAAAKLNELQERLLFSEKRAQEELYDLQADPYETNNLAADAAHKTTLTTMRNRLDQWMDETNDHGRKREPESMYDSDMAARDPAGGALAPGEGAGAENVKLMKRWAVEKPMRVKVISAQ